MQPCDVQQLFRKTFEQLLHRGSATANIFYKISKVQLGDQDHVSDWLDAKLAGLQTTSINRISLPEIGGL